jgi:hypothetical protein|eukprot:COSAG01_NODE_127_length_24940_cov_140.519923_24_plen_79_part_00
MLRSIVRDLLSWLLLVGMAWILIRWPCHLLVCVLIMQRLVWWCQMLCWQVLTLSRIFRVKGRFSLYSKNQNLRHTKST